MPFIPSLHKKFIPTYIIFIAIQLKVYPNLHNIIAIQLYLNNEVNSNLCQNPIKFRNNFHCIKFLSQPIAPSSLMVKNMCFLLGGYRFKYGGVRVYTSIYVSIQIIARREDHCLTNKGVSYIKLVSAEGGILVPQTNEPHASNWYLDKLWP